MRVCTLAHFRLLGNARKSREVSLLVRIANSGPVFASALKYAWRLFIFQEQNQRSHGIHAMSNECAKCG